MNPYTTSWETWKMQYYYIEGYNPYILLIKAPPVKEVRTEIIPLYIRTLIHTGKGKILSS